VPLVALLSADSDPYVLQYPADLNEQLRVFESRFVVGNNHEFYSDNKIQERVSNMPLEVPKDEWVLHSQS